LAFEVRRHENGSHDVVDRETGQPACVDGAELVGLSALAAHAYLEALEVSQGVEGIYGDVRLHYAIERSLRPDPVVGAVRMDDVLISIRWMMPELKLGLDIMKPLIRRIAEESGHTLVE
jgi:hypothetical protein